MARNDFERSENWLVCDNGSRHGGSVCLYSESAVARLKSDPPRCLKHGIILDWASDLRGLTRAEARAKIDRSNGED